MKFLTTALILLSCAALTASVSLVSGCSSDQVTASLVAAEKIDDALQAKAQAQVNAMPAGPERDKQQARVTAAKANADLYLVIGETVAPLLVTPPTTQPAK